MRRVTFRLSHGNVRYTWDWPQDHLCMQGYWHDPTLRVSRMAETPLGQSLCWYVKQITLLYLFFLIIIFYSWVPKRLPPKESSKPRTVKYNLNHSTNHPPVENHPACCNHSYDNSGACELYSSTANYNGSTACNSSYDYHNDNHYNKTHNYSNYYDGVYPSDYDDKSYDDHDNNHYDHDDYDHDYHNGDDYASSE